MKHALIVVASATAGCLGSPEPVAIPTFGGVGPFEQTAQPVLVERCANPSCHGNAGRPLSLYGVRRHRKDARDNFAETPLTSEETAHNHAQASAFLLGVDRASDSLLLKKPLGDAHAGGAVFEDETEEAYVRLRAWCEAAVAARGIR